MNMDVSTGSVVKDNHRRTRGGGEDPRRALHLARRRQHCRAVPPRWHADPLVRPLKQAVPGSRDQFPPQEHPTQAAAGRAVLSAKYGI